MRSLALAIVLVAAVGLMVYTNPSVDDFSNYARHYLMKEAQIETKDPVGKLFGSILGGIAGGVISSQTTRTDYVVFSIYELEIGRERLKAIGLFKNFYLLEKPDLKQYNLRERPGK